MKILAFDTSSPASSVALFCDGQTYAIYEPQIVRQGTHLLPLIADLLAQASLTMANLDAIALGVGPGSFTGLRIGCSAAQAIAFSHNLPILPISSLQILAQTAYRRYGGNHFLVAVDARKGQYYCGEYQLQDDTDSVHLIGEETLVGGLSNEIVLGQHQAPPCLSTQSQAVVIAVGNAWTAAESHHLLRRFKVQNTVTSYIPELLPEVSTIFNLVQLAYAKRQWVGAAELSPSYLNDMSFSVTFQIGKSI